MFPGVLEQIRNSHLKTWQWHHDWRYDGQAKFSNQCIIKLAKEHFILLQFHFLSVLTVSSYKNTKLESVLKSAF